LRIKITAVGALSRGLPGGRGFIEGQGFTVGEALGTLVAENGQLLAEELYEGDQLRERLAILVNGRNVLSLPEGLRTALGDGDEVLITTIVPGG
jgi:molybdopterin converting factor small subunit